MIRKLIGAEPKRTLRSNRLQGRQESQLSDSLPVETFQSSGPSPSKKTTSAFEPVLHTVKLSEEQKSKPVPREVVEKAQKQLDEGDRGGAYLTFYKELGSEQVLAQAQITTYTGLWGSGALAGNSRAKDLGGGHYNIPLDQFSTDIAQGTIDSIRKDLDEGGTGRLSESQFRAVDRQVWKDKKMGNLFPGNVQFWDPWNHIKGDRAAIISRSTVNMAKVALRSCLSVVGFSGGDLGLNRILQVGKRPAEFAKDPNYQTYGDKSTRFITVVDKRTGFVEAFWDNEPKFGKARVPQLANEAVSHESPTFKQRNFLYDKLGANLTGKAQVLNGESNPAVDDNNSWFFA